MFYAELNNPFRAVHKWKCKTQKLSLETRLHTNIIASTGKKWEVGWEKEENGVSVNTITGSGKGVVMR